MQQGEHLKKQCKFWARTWQRQVVWVPEAGLKQGSLGSTVVQPPARSSVLFGKVGQFYKELPPGS